MKKFLKKFLNFCANTTVRVISFLIVLCLIGGYFVFPDFYKHQWDKIKSYYYVYLGDKAYKKSNTLEAINNYTIALNLHPKHTKARYNLANLYVVYEDYFQAVANYQKALELKPDYTVARIDYAVVLQEIMFNYDKAIEQYNISLEKTPKWVYIPFIINNKKTYRHNRGVAYYNMGLAWRGKSLIEGQDRFKSRQFLSNAVESYEKALKTLKEYDVYYNLGIANQLLRRNYASGRYYCKAIEKEPLNYEAHFNLAILLKTMEQYGASVEEFKKAGLLLDMKGDANKTRYIYDVLNDVNQKLALDSAYQKEKLLKDENEVSNGKLAYIKGKLVASDEFDKAIMRNFENCTNKKFFFEGEDLE